MVYGIQEGNSKTESISMKLAVCFLAVSAGVWSAAQADEPPSPAAQPPAAQAPAAQAPAPSAPSSTADATAAPGTPAPAPKAEKSEAVNADATEADINKMRSRGYKTVKRNGKLMFCRDEGAIGTNFQRTRCSTLEQLKEEELSGQEYARSLAHH
jgi:hypothetical protein